MQTSALEVQFARAVAAAGLRMTAARKGIFTVLFSAERPLQIAEIVQQIPDVHFVSVYRSIDALLKAQLIKQVPSGFKNRFELSDMFKPHHHHITCEKCGDVKEIASDDVEKIIQHLARQSSFRHTRHHFEAFGICSNCKNK